jgi:hypothetical protein
MMGAGNYRQSLWTAVFWLVAFKSLTLCELLPGKASKFQNYAAPHKKFLTGFEISLKYELLQRTILLFQLCLSPIFNKFKEKIP